MALGIQPTSTRTTAESDWRPDSATTEELPHYPVTVVGTGPAGLAAANELFKHGIQFALIGQPNKHRPNRPAFGGGLATYNWPANSTGNELLFDIDKGDPLAKAHRKHIAKRLAEMTGKSPNLRRAVRRYLHNVGREITRLRPRDVYAQEVHHTVWDGKRHILFNKNGEPVLTASYVCFCIGAHEKSLAEADARFANYKIESSLDILRGTSLRRLKHQLKTSKEQDSKVVIVGTSHTGFSVAARLCKDGIRIGHFTRDNSEIVQLLEHLLPKKIGCYIHAGRLLMAFRGDDPCIKIFAESAKAAVEDDLELGPAELVNRSTRVCQKTGRYRRFGGVRGEAGELARRVKLGLEPRIDLVPLDQLSRTTLDRAIIVQAIGLEGNAFSVQEPGQPPYQLPVNHGNIVGDPRGRIPGLPNTYGFGVGVDVPHDAQIGGEPAFTHPDGTPRALHLVAGYNLIAKAVARDIAERLERHRPLE